LCGSTPPAASSAEVARLAPVALVSYAVAMLILQRRKGAAATAFEPGQREPVAPPPHEAGEPRPQHARPVPPPRAEAGDP